MQRLKLYCSKDGCVAAITQPMYGQPTCNTAPVCFVLTANGSQQYKLTSASTAPHTTTHITPHHTHHTYYAQGSNDLQHWLDLRRHQWDTTIHLPGQYGSWPVTGPAASMPFRAFRLLLLGPTTSATSPWAFCLSYWELYGYFYKMQPDEGARAGLNAAAVPGQQQEEHQQQVQLEQGQKEEFQQRQQQSPVPQ